MTDEELNRKFEFIANVLADVSVSQQNAEKRMELAEKQMEFAKERMGLAEKRMDRADDRIGRLERVLLLAIRAGQREWREHFRVLADSQMRLEAVMVEAQARNDTAFAKLAESQTHTNRRLDTLIDIVRERLNGEGK